MIFMLYFSPSGGSAQWQNHGARVRLHLLDFEIDVLDSVHTWQQWFSQVAAKVVHQAQVFFSKKSGIKLPKERRTNGLAFGCSCLLCVLISLCILWLWLVLAGFEASSSCKLGLRSCLKIQYFVCVKHPSSQISCLCYICTPDLMLSLHQPFHAWFCNFGPWPQTNGRINKSTMRCTSFLPGYLVCTFWSWLILSRLRK